MNKKRRAAFFYRKWRNHVLDARAVCRECGEKLFYIYIDTIQNFARNVTNGYMKVAMISIVCSVQKDRKHQKLL